MAEERVRFLFSPTATTAQPPIDLTLPDTRTTANVHQLLRINATLPPFSLWHYAKSTCIVTQQINMVAVFMVAFAAAADDAADERLLAGVVLAATLLLLVGCYCLRTVASLWEFAWAAKRALVLTALHAALAPMLHTLTASIATDSTYTNVGVLWLVHLATHDYEFAATLSTKFTASLSLQCAMLASILLGSRFASPLQAYLLTSLCFVLFALMPTGVLHALKTQRPQLHWLLTWACVPVLTAALWPLPALAWTYLALVGVVSVVAPLTYWYLRRFKRRVNGPWDEVVPMHLGPVGPYVLMDNSTLR